jgi:hypothetical protein
LPGFPARVAIEEIRNLNGEREANQNLHFDNQPIDVQRCIGGYPMHKRKNRGRKNRQLTGGYRFRKRTMRYFNNGNWFSKRAVSFPILEKRGNQLKIEFVRNSKGV